MKNSKTSPERRKFLGQAGAATAAALAAGAIGLSPALGGKGSIAAAASQENGHGDGDGNGNGKSARRANDCFDYRKKTAQDEKVNVGFQPDNGDPARFTDFSCSYSKGLPHGNLGIPNAAAMLSMKKAFDTGKASDFANIIVGTPGGGPNSKLNGPQVALAFDLEGLDSHATVVPAAPSVASAWTAAEEVEHYWGALLRDVNFTDYATNPLVGQAVADMNNMSFLASAANKQFPYPVTRQNLFRGQFVPGDGNVKGPYLSQFMIQPTYYGSQLLDQKHRTYLPAGAGGTEYMTDVEEFKLIQNGGDSHRPINYDPTPRYLRNGRDLSAYTQVDVLYQGYFTAFLMLAGIGAPPNPGNPYIGSVSQKAFATLGGPDAAGTIAEMASRALKASWFHKWVKDLRMRPEEYGGLVHARKTGASPMPQAAAALHADVLNSAVLPIINSTYGSYLLPQAFPEGSPTHPCYPTGHGTVGGACITALKFFFDGSRKIRPLLQARGLDVYEPSADGLSLNTYTGADRNSLDINGELNKLAHNVTFGHGIHAGIHFRSSSYWSVLLGEQVALSVLRDRAKGYNEPFTISITKFDGTTATITNQ
ncbi:MAG TPA: vanadium-dependent haloperoxidase [Pyrinomonadaceae bacterium]|jgi:hypothetical protein|nr:vanadium-dependent haloperoxidase [Pyrinomonadaceae bacterium]